MQWYTLGSTRYAIFELQAEEKNMPFVPHFRAQT